MMSRNCCLFVDQDATVYSAARDNGYLQQSFNHYGGRV